MGRAPQLASQVGIVTSTDVAFLKPYQQRGRKITFLAGTAFSIYFFSVVLVGSMEHAVDILMHGKRAS